MRYSLQIATFAAALGLAASPMLATAISGDANIGGSVSVSGTAINFNGTFDVPLMATEDGAFAGLTGSDAGTIQSLTNGVTGAISVPKFMVFSGGVATPVYFDLTSIPLGFGSVAGCSSDTPGSECTLSGSPFTIIQSPSSITAELTLFGDAYTGSSTSGYSPYTVGAFTTQSTITGYSTITALVAALTAGDTISGQTYSASFTAVAPTVPEPATLVLVGAGLLGAGLIARRKRSA